MRVVLLVLVSGAFLAGPLGNAAERLRLATTTSTENSGLLAAILPRFEQLCGCRVEVLAVGSGKALRIAAGGDADLVLSHAPALEEAFLEAGDGVNPREVMYNDFVVVGPPDDPGGLRGLGSAAAAMRRIAATRVRFVSRGDESGTHQRERALWRMAGVSPRGSWYIEAGLGMGPALVLAAEKAAYTLTDRGTYIATRERTGLAIVVEGDPALRNVYRVIAVNPARHPHVNYRGAMALIAWLTSPEGQRLIGEFKARGQVLFHPLAVPLSRRRAPHPLGGTACGRPRPASERLARAAGGASRRRPATPAPPWARPRAAAAVPKIPELPDGLAR